MIFLARQEEAPPVLLQHPEMCQSSGAAGIPVPHHTGRTPAVAKKRTSRDVNGRMLLASFPFQLCVERCPDRHLTLVKAKVGNKDDHEYYRQYCKEGVDFAKLVRRQMVVRL